ncbi:Prostaglandin F synthase [Tetrabaena socialis]|uniref:Prostaglandin F synthase n=1 Tax=Tetrabaena socialis TaxID=47790 RepID=A0A2J7ZM42_9CHLO|nr:Prostaglandin F synthase [Tetrabaena socialis]|eukprot:PNH01337.1 Prostaglandin F synthase [Tetrabaena socialis]
MASGAVPGRPLPRTLTLRNGVELPAVGLGTFKAAGEEARTAVAAALRAGLRHIDTATIYKNEGPIREALAASGLPRASVFLTSKVSPYDQGAGRARAAELRAEAELHFGRGLGASACRCALSPFRDAQLSQSGCCLGAWLGGVAVVAYASLGASDLLSHPVVRRLAKEVRRSPAQEGVAVIPKSVRPERVAEWSEGALLGREWGLAAAQVAALAALEDGHKYCWDPEGIV